MNKKTLVSALTVVVLAGGLTGAVAANAAGNAEPQFETNSTGETYGSLADVPLADGPDLILAYGTDGKTLGYVKKSDLLSPAPKSPADAIAQQEAWLKEYPDGKAIALYDVDGRTVIGSYLIAPPQR